MQIHTHKLQIWPIGDDRLLLVQPYHNNPATPVMTSALLFKCPFSVMTLFYDPVSSHLWHPTVWSVDCLRLRGPGWSRSDVQIVAHLYQPHWWCGLAASREEREGEGKRETDGLFCQIHSMKTRESKYIHVYLKNSSQFKSHFHGEWAWESLDVTD